MSVPFVRMGFAKTTLIYEGIKLQFGQFDQTARNGPAGAVENIALHLL